MTRTYNRCVGFSRHPRPSVDLRVIGRRGAALSCERAGRPRLVDCLMSGEQGNSLAEHASELGVPTILTSGDPHYIETRSAHPFPFLAKPFRLTSLDELIARTLHTPGTDRSP